MSLSLPGYQLMSPIAKMPGTLYSNAAVSTRMYSPSFIAIPQSATGPSFMVKPKNGSSASQAISKFEPSLRFTMALAIRPPSPASAAARDNEALAAQRHKLPDGAVNRSPLIGLDAGNLRAIGLERAAACRDH